MIRKSLLALFILGMAACGDSATNQTPEQQAAAACEAEAQVRTEGKTFALDSAALAGSAKAQDNIWEMQAPITIQPGLRDEAKQTLKCRVRLQQGKEPEIISIGFEF